MVNREDIVEHFKKQMARRDEPSRFEKETNQEHWDRTVGARKASVDLGRQSRANALRLIEEQRKAKEAENQ